MSAFLTTADFQSRLSDRVIELLTGSVYTNLETASNEAAGLLRDRLLDKYAIDGELAKTGTDRNTVLIRYALSIAVYSLYSKIPDEEIPERVIKDYDDAMDDLKLISQGKLSSTLPLNTDSDGETVSRIRMGSNDPRSHNPYRYP
jgi:phage gp36-like protein